MMKERAIKVIDCILNDTLCDGCIGEDTTSCVECRREVADMAIEALQEKKTGKWIHKREYDLYPYDILTCSACGETDARMYRSDSYCPNCGARMECEEE